LGVNPYHLGFSMWDTIIERDGIDAARAIMQQDDDFSFIRNYLTAEMAEKLKMFRYNASSNGEIKVAETNLNSLHEALLAPKYNFGAPSIAATHVHVDGTLELQHDHSIDGRGLDAERGRKVLEYIERVWRRPVRMHTIDERGDAIELRAQAA
jgi:stage V sporulation protein R